MLQAWWWPWMLLPVNLYVNALMWDLRSGYFLLEPWDLKALSHSPHLGVTVTVRDPNHEVLHSQERFITKPGSLKHMLTGFPIQTKPKQRWNAFNTASLKISAAWFDPWDRISVIVQEHQSHISSVAFCLSGGGSRLFKSFTLVKDCYHRVEIHDYKLTSWIQNLTLIKVYKSGCYSIILLDYFLLMH